MGGHWVIGGGVWLCLWGAAAFAQPSGHAPCCPSHPSAHGDMTGHDLSGARPAHDATAWLAKGRDLQARGYANLALDAFEQAERAAGSERVRLRADICLAKADVLVRMQRWAEANRSIAAAGQLAEQSGDGLLTARVTVAEGVWLVSQGRAAEALAHFESVSVAAVTQADDVVRTIACLNAARAAAWTGDDAKAKAHARAAGGLLDQLPTSVVKARLLAAAGGLDGILPAADRQALLADAIRLEDAQNDPSQVAAGLIALSEVYASQDRVPEALQLARRAMFVAQAHQRVDAKYQAQWAVGRHLARTPQGAAEAILAYEGAVATVQAIRPDLTARYGVVASWPEGLAAPAPTFRRVMGPLYFELADLYLRRAEQGGEESEGDLIRARTTIEMFRVAEIEDYLQKRCVQLRSDDEFDIFQTAPGTAVVYYIPLADRLEILVSHAGALTRYPAAVTAADLEQMADQFRMDAESRGLYDYLDSSAALYEALIRPFEALLDGQVHTLVFVPDGVLRTVPMAALFDGERFLVERAAVAVSPGLSLLESGQRGEGRPRVLLGGVSERVGGFAALPNVTYELTQIQETYGGRKLLNDAFTTDRVAQEVAEHPYTIVHIATHGEFRSEMHESFLMLYDGKMSLDRLEQIIRPVEFRGRPVELLALSACRTAAGDDRAALGLAGVAVKAGARSALATLWCVDDQASATLVARFYELLNDPGMSKAHALRQAQVELLRDPAFRDSRGRIRPQHPALWSPFVIIGNWL